MQRATIRQVVRLFGTAVFMAVTVCLIGLNPSGTPGISSAAYQAGNSDDAGEWTLYQRSGSANIYQNTSNPDEFQARIQTRPINYWDGEEFEPIDLAIKAISDEHYIYEMSAAPYQVYFPESLDYPIKITSQERRYEFTLVEMSYNAEEDFLATPQPTAPVISDQTVIYPDAFCSIDIKIFNILNSFCEVPA